MKAVRVISLKKKKTSAKRILYNFSYWKLGINEDEHKIGQA